MNLELTCNKGTWREWPFHTSALYFSFSSAISGQWASGKIPSTMSSLQSTKTNTNTMRLVWLKLMSSPTVSPRAARERMKLESICAVTLTCDDLINSSWMSSSSRSRVLPTRCTAILTCDLLYGIFSSFFMFCQSQTYTLKKGYLSCIHDYKMNSRPWCDRHIQHVQIIKKQTNRTHLRVRHHVNIIADGVNKFISHTKA